MHKFINSDLGTRSTEECLLEQGELTQLDFSFAPEKQAEIIDQLNMVQVFVIDSLLVVLFA